MIIKGCKELKNKEYLFKYSKSWNQVGGLGANIPTKLNIFVFLTKTNPRARWNGAFSSVIIALH